MIDWDLLRAHMTPLVHAAVWGDEFPPDEADCCVEEMLKALHKHLNDRYLD